MNDKKLIIPQKIVTVDKDEQILSDTAVVITNDLITGLISASEVEKEEFEGNVYEYGNLTLIPGFVQTHIHLCQTLFRGLADDLQLLEWLQQKIFPFENAHNKRSLKASVKIGLNEILSGGTTTVLDMGTLKYQEVVFEEMIASGIRGFSGKCLIDENNLFPDFKSNTKDELKYMNDLARDYHNIEKGRIRYGFAPRFVLSCSEQLLKETKSMKNDFPGSIYHTHASESKGEIEEVRKKHNKENIEYFDSINVLDKETILAHCIHLNESEKQILKNKKVRVAHCPSANLKLGSGIANIPDYIKRGISVSIGADGAPCNNNLSIFTEMRLSALIQKPIHGADVMDAKTVYKLATIEGAKALHLENEIGSIEVGKKADLALIDLNTATNSLSDEENIYSDIIYSSNGSNVKSVMVNGKWLFRDGKSIIYDEEEIVAEASGELKKLLKRL